MPKNPFHLGNFEFIEALQISNDVAVVSCRDMDSNQKVTCKTSASLEPSDEQIASLKREYELTQKVQGDDIVELLDLKKGESGCPILVFKSFAGTKFEMGELQLRPEEYLPIFIRIVKAVGSIHLKKVIHRDLNPNNILWNPETADVRIIDFNLATDILSETIRAENVDSLCGTLPYISPEQTGRMNRKVDFRSDYYSLGMVFFNFLSGRSPFNATDAISWVYCHIAEQPCLVCDLNAAIPRPIAFIIDKMLAKNAESRYQSSYGLIRDLQLVAEGLTNNSLQNFEPGAFDVSESLNMPEKLYGREAELKRFLSFFDHVKAGGKSMCIISGPSGMGKSVLVHEIQKPVIAARGNFISGKCDQYKRNVPYSAIKDAFADLIRQFLTRSPEEVNYIRQKIIDAIGDNAKVIAEVVPELEALTGPQGSIPKLPPNEARLRFQRAFEGLIRVFTTDGQALVAFLDDLQWADLPSLKLIEFLMTEAKLQSLMIVAVFRDNEVLPGHPLLMTLDEIQKVHEVPSVKLSPLSQSSISHLLADTLHYKPSQTLELADIINHKTAGNPFHITELIKTLHNLDAIYFDAHDGRWLWDLEKIAGAGVSSDVVELMVATLQKCPVAAQDKLKMAACIGAQFELNTLASVCDKDVLATLEDLWSTIEKGLIIPIGESYKLLKSGMTHGDRRFFFKFQHDRVHEAAYMLINEADLPAVHLEIGRTLRRKFDGPELESQIIEIARHYNLGAGLVLDPQERLTICRLNFQASTKARNSAAFESCLHYLVLAKAFLPADCWAEHYNLSRSIFMALTEIAFLMKDDVLTQEANTELLNNTKDLLDRAEVLGTLSEQKFNRGDAQEGLAAGVLMLSSLGVRIPKKPSKFTFLRYLGRIKRLLKKTNLDEVTYGKRLEDRRHILILTQLWNLNKMYQTSGERISSGITTLELIRLSLKHGICAESSCGFIGGASIFTNVVGDVETGRKLAKISLDIIEKFGSPLLKPIIYHVYASFVAPWIMNLEKVADIYALTIEAGVAVGDQYSLSAAAIEALKVDPQLGVAEAYEKAEKYYLPLVKSINSRKLYEMAVSLHMLRKAILEEESEAQTEQRNDLDNKTLALFSELKFYAGYFILRLYRAESDFLFGKYDKGFQEIKAAEAYYIAGRGTFHEANFHFYNILLSTRVYPEASRQDQRKIRKSLKFSMARMKLFSRIQPHNFLFKYHAMEAEIFRMHGNRQAATELYDQALACMDKVFKRDVAIVNELCGRFYMECGKTRIAEIFLMDAYNAYQGWEAHGKLGSMTREWPFLGQTLQSIRQAAPRGSSVNLSQQSINLTHNSAHSLDATTITKAAQSLSSQVEMEGLIKQMMQIIVENAAAQYAVLMIREKGKSHVKVVATTLNSETILVNDQSLSTFPDLSLSVMLYTTRINETVIIDDIEKDEKFKSDIYLQRVRPRSVLAMPITIHGHAIGYFYLENRLVTGGFTADRVKVLNILGTQAAISLENAQLYASLEAKVRERTKQLAEKSRDMRSILSHIKQGILTLGPNLQVHPEYSTFLESIFETKSLADQNFMTLLGRDSNLTTDTLDQIKSALECSIQQNALGFSCNEGLLIRELIRTRPDGEPQYLELDWEPIVNGEQLVEKIMVTIRDVSELRKLRETSERNRRELNLLNQLLNTSAETYVRFADNTKDLLRKATDIINNIDERELLQIDIAYRHLHTIKGNARLIGFVELTSLVHDCESIIARIKHHSIPLAEGRIEVLKDLNCIQDTLEEYQDVYTNRLLAYGTAGSGQRAQRLIGLLQNKLPQWQQLSPDICADIVVLIENLDKKTLQEIIEPLRLNTTQLAAEMGKEAPRVSVEGPGILIDARTENLLTNTFVHLFSNSIHHGLEPTAVRLQKGKAAEGHIHVRLVDNPDGIGFFVYDDGQGLNLEAIKAKALSKGLIDRNKPISDLDIALLIFKSGFSTAEQVSQSAGRGVGMDAIKDMIDEAGGHLELILDETSPVQSKMFQLHFVLPNWTKTADREAA